MPLVFCSCAAGAHVKFSDAVKLLGVTLDSALMFDKHITNVTRCSHYHIRALRHICPLLTLDTAKTIAASIVGSRLDYCNSLLYGVSQANIDRLQRAQNVLARVVAQAPSTISSADIHCDLHWLPINHRISYKLSLLTWRALYTAEPSYLSELISPYVPARTLRSSNTYFLSIPMGVTSHFSSSSFSVSAPSTWNSLPQHNSLYRQTLNVRLPDTSAPRHFGTRTFRHQYRMVPKYLETFRHHPSKIHMGYCFVRIGLLLVPCAEICRSKIHETYQEMR